MNKEKIFAFWKDRAQKADKNGTNLRDDPTLKEIDIALIKQHLPEQAIAIDLGAGDCTLTNALVPLVKEITAVEHCEDFLKKAHTSPNLHTVCQDLASYSIPAKHFDLAILFGVTNYLSHSEANTLYQRIASGLTDRGVFIAKHQCGVEGEVMVDHYSEALGQHYHARYPDLGAEQAMLSQLFEVNTIDIYPPSANTWANTHFYAFVCRKRSS